MPVGQRRERLGFQPDRRRSWLLNRVTIEVYLKRRLLWLSSLTLAGTGSRGGEGEGVLWTSLGGLGGGGDGVGSYKMYICRWLFSVSYLTIIFEYTFYTLKEIEAHQEFVKVSIYHSISPCHLTLVTLNLFNLTLCWSYSTYVTGSKVINFFEKLVRKCDFIKFLPECPGSCLCPTTKIVIVHYAVVAILGNPAFQRLLLIATGTWCWTCRAYM